MPIKKIHIALVDVAPMTATAAAAEVAPLEAPVRKYDLAYYKGLKKVPSHQQFMKTHTLAQLNDARELIDDAMDDMDEASAEYKLLHSIYNTVTDITFSAKRAAEKKRRAAVKVYPLNDAFAQMVKGDVDQVARSIAGDIQHIQKDVDRAEAVYQALEMHDQQTHDLLRAAASKSGYEKLLKWMVKNFHI